MEEIDIPNLRANPKARSREKTATLNSLNSQKDTGYSLVLVMLQETVGINGYSPERHLLEIVEPSRSKVF